MNHTAYRFTVMLLGCFLIASTALALEFAMPLDCHYGQNCFIQNYVDDVASSHSDYQCGHLTYNGHKGTDFRLRDFTDMQRGVKVLVAADGKVLRLRNNAPDTGLNAGREAISHHECGNGIVIAHADGFETQYCHLKQGSIVVHAGDAVKAGDVIGEVGYSGETEFPHVHFQVTHHGQIIDPFNAATPATNASCTGDHLSLWAPQTKLPYIDTTILSSGISNAIPKRDSISAPLVAMQTAPATSPMLTFWVNAMGLKAGDKMHLQLIAPDGSIIAEAHTPIEKFKASYFQYVGKKFHAPLAAGTYVGKVNVERNGATLPSANSTVSIVVN